MTQWANRAWWGPLCWNEAQMRPRRPVQTEYLYLFLYLYLNIYLYLYLGGTILFKWAANEAETSSPVLALASSAPPKCGSPTSHRGKREKEKKTTNDGIDKIKPILETQSKSFFSTQFLHIVQWVLCVSLKAWFTNFEQTLTSLQDSIAVSQFTNSESETNMLV